MSDKASQVALLRNLQYLVPVVFLVGAVATWFSWKDDMAPIVAAALLFVAVTDFFIFRFMADRIENGSGS